MEDDDDYLYGMSQYNIYVVRVSIKDVVYYKALFLHEAREEFHRVDAICITAAIDEFRAHEGIALQRTYAGFKTFVQDRLNSNQGGDNGQSIEKILKTIENYHFIVSVKRVCL